MRTALLALAAASCLWSACRTERTTGSTSVSPPTLSSATPAPLAARMPAHDARGNAVRDAVARADLEAARREAKALAELRVEGAVDTAWQSRLDAMRTAASRIANAQDLSEASRGLAVLARTCGDCHATSAQRNVAVGEPPRTSVNVVPRMRRHEWGVERMWEGLVVPSEEAWRTGARVLADAPLQPESISPGEEGPVSAVSGLVRTVHERADQARVATSAVDREAIFGELMTTCSACHQWLGGGPPSR